MGTEGLLSPQVLWLLLWVQMCRGKCWFPCPTSWGQWAPVGSWRSLWECGFFPGSTETRVRRCSSPWTFCLFLCLSVFMAARAWLYRQPIPGYPFGTPFPQCCAFEAGGGSAGDGSTQRSPGHSQSLGCPGGFVCCSLPPGYRGALTPGRQFVPHREKGTGLSAPTGGREVSFLGAPAKHRGWADARGEEGTWVGGTLRIISMLPEDTGSHGSGVGLGGSKADGGQGKLWAWGHGAAQGVLDWCPVQGRGHSVWVGMGRGSLEWEEVPRAVGR